MEIYTVASFTGGQGKSTTALVVGRMLSEGYRVLLVDCEPQSSLTSWILGHYLEPGLMSLRDVLEGNAPVEDCMFQLSENLYLLPSEETLIKAETSLANSGRSAIILRKRLKEVANQFDYCLIDTPPEPIQLAMTSLGAANRVIIPVTADLKGVQAFARTLSVLADFADDMELDIPVFGVLPFKVSMYGNNMFAECKKSLDQIAELAAAKGIPLLPSIVRSDQFDRALANQLTLQGLGEKFHYLEEPFQKIAEQIVGKEAGTWRTKTLQVA